MEFRILGPLEVVEDGEPVALGTLKERLVLGVLLLHANEFVSRERLIDDLWGEAPPPTARQAVNVYLSKLRKALGRAGADPIATASGGYRLHVDPERLDASRMQVLVVSARESVSKGELEHAAERFREALALWRGPALAGLQLESRGRDEVAQLDELRLAALMDWIDCELALGRHEQALGELNLLVREHPLRERLRASSRTASSVSIPAAERSSRSLRSGLSRRGSPSPREESGPTISPRTLSPDTTCAPTRSRRWVPRQNHSPSSPMPGTPGSRVFAVPRSSPGSPRSAPASQQAGALWIPRTRPKFISLRRAPYHSPSGRATCGRSPAQRPLRGRTIGCGWSTRRAIGSSACCGSDVRPRRSPSATEPPGSGHSPTNPTRSRASRRRGGGRAGFSQSNSARRGRARSRTASRPATPQV